MGLFSADNSRYGFEVRYQFFSHSYLIPLMFVYFVCFFYLFRGIFFISVSLPYYPAQILLMPILFSHVSYDISYIANLFFQTNK